jgi:hypothetical protein
LNQHHGHVFVESSQFRAGIRAPAVGEVDEIHNLNLATRGGAESSDQLKYLAERIPATFVYAGIDVEHAGLFSGVRGRQIAGRFASIATTSFAYGTRAQREQWAALIGALEQALRLHQHRAGTLLRLAGYLHQRTGGMIGSLSHLIRDAAIEAIFDGSERITKTALDRVILDHAAEHPRTSTKIPAAAETSVRPHHQEQRSRLTVTEPRLDHDRYWARRLRPLPIRVAPLPGELMVCYLRDSPRPTAPT